ncbi:MAG: hypothetical protein ACRD4Z_00390, partial [Nitrososphaeraceae archaeon]
SRVVNIGITHVLTKMGLMGVQLRIALKNELQNEFELIDNEEQLPKNETNNDAGPEVSSTDINSSSKVEGQEVLAAKGNTNG